jgi:Protein of unknown function (DUF4238)
LAVDATTLLGRALQSGSISQAIQCEFCKHGYIMPCTDNEQEKCPNMIWLRSQGAVPAQQSFRHHYIPKFYSKRWGGEDFKITEFSRPYKTLQARQVYPVQTGFADRLYEMKGVPASAAQKVEDEFMKPVDSDAAVALELLETEDSRIHTEPKYRSAWSQFLITLMIRTPKDLAVLAQALADDWARDFPMFEKKYLSSRKPDEPATLQDFIDQKDPDFMARWTIDYARELMNHDELGQLLNNLRWFVLTTKADVPQFLTSDRPVVMSDTLTADDSYLYLPLGPHRLFVAVTNAAAEERIRRFPSLELVDETNRLVTLQASKYVYGADKKAIEFVEKYFGKPGPKSLMERLRDHRNEKAKESQNLASGHS